MGKKNAQVTTMSVQEAKDKLRAAAKKTDPQKPSRENLIIAVLVCFLAGALVGRSDRSTDKALDFLIKLLQLDL